MIKSKIELKTKNNKYNLIKKARKQKISLQNKKNREITLNNQSSTKS